MTAALHRLPNRLTVAVDPLPGAESVALGLYATVGSRSEPEQHSGLAHLVEHMLFKGAGSRSTRALAEAIEDVGGVLNAYTAFDQTVYWETVPSNALELALWLEAERMASLAVDEENMRSERDVVIEELRLRVENPPYGRLNQIVFATSYTTHSYKWMPIGSKEDLLAATLERMFDDGRADPFYAALRSPGHDTALAALRNELGAPYQRVFAGLAADGGDDGPDPDAALRADLLLAWLFGIGFARSVLGTPSLVEADAARVTALVRSAADSLLRSRGD